MPLALMRRFSAAILMAALFAGHAHAQEALEGVVPTEPVEAQDHVPTGVGGIETAAKQMYMIDLDTDTVLASKDADSRMFPSSMTKLMTLYVLFERLKEGSLKLTDTFTVSEKAWRMQGSKMFVPIGAAIPLEDLIRGISVQSGNDACVVVAEGVAGSEEQFAKLMNDTAAKLGMKNSHFVNASGWPDEDHYTTAHDLAILGERIILDFPEYHGYSGEREYTYNNIRQANRNPLLGRTDLGVDGLKTGHTEIAGYGIVLSNKEPGTGRRLVLVVNGLDSEKARAEEGGKLLTYGLRQFENKTVAEPGDLVTQAPVWLGVSDGVGLTVKDRIVLNLPQVGREGITFKAIYGAPIAAPVAAGQEVGQLEIRVPGREVKRFPLVTAGEVARKSAFARIPYVIGSWLGLH